MHVPTLSTCAHIGAIPRHSEEGAGVRDSHEQPYGSREPIPGPLQEQQVLSTTEPSPQRTVGNSYANPLVVSECILLPLFTFDIFQSTHTHTHTPPGESHYGFFF